MRRFGSIVRTLVAITTVLLAAAGAVTAARAGEPSGLWTTEGGKARVRIVRCAEAFCGTIVWLKDPIDPATGKAQADSENEDAAKRNRPVIGIEVVIGMKLSGADTWSGRLYSPEEGKTVAGKLVLKDANTLRVEGCLLGGLLCRSEIWARAK